MAIKSDAQRRAVAKYNAKSYDQVQIRITKGTKNIIQSAADKLNLSVNKFLINAIADACHVPASTFEKEESSEVLR